ncbi:MAG: hypothetical protein ACPL7A_00940, partial [Anaerolineales bacterium]
MNQILKIILALGILFCNTCSSKKPDLGMPLTWNNLSLRAIDPVDTPQPSQDLIAVESQFSPTFLTYNEGYLYLRLDFLAPPTLTPKSIYIFFDTAPGGSQSQSELGKVDIPWEFYLFIGANEIAFYNTVNQTVSGISATIWQGTDKDFLQIAIKYHPYQTYIPPTSRVQIYITFNQQILDQSEPINLSQLPPRPLNILMVFWNSYPSPTPVQALRHWDGAHSGPLGERHGLYNLIRAANAADVPIMLLDLKSPQSLSALDYAGKLAYIMPLVSAHKIILPDYLPINPLSQPNHQDSLSGEFTLKLAQNFGFAKSPFLFIPSIEKYLSENSGLHAYSIFTLGDIENSSIQITTLKNTKLWVIPKNISNPQFQPDEVGLSIEIKKEMIQALIANQQNGNVILALGGDLTKSTWGDYQIAHNG